MKFVFNHSKNAPRLLFLIKYAVTMYTGLLPIRNKTFVMLWVSLMPLFMYILFAGKKHNLINFKSILLLNL